SSGGTGLAGVTMTLSGAAGGTTTTDASGSYQFAGLLNGSYTVTPSRAGYIFAPTNAAVTVAGANVTAVNFTATAVYTVSGTVTSGGTGLAGVTMTLSGAGSGTTTTDASGNYQFAGLVNGSYTITPSRAGFIFAPASAAATVAGANVTGVDFAATAVYTVSGTVSSGGTGLAGVTMTLSGAGSGTTTTDASGAYQFPDLPDGAYTVTPSFAGYIFAPTSVAATVAGADATGVNFAATAVYTVSGSVTSGATGLAGVTMTLSGAATATTTTDASGAYTFTSLVDGSYTITPSLPGYVFAPADASITVAGADVTNVDFAATAVFTVSGTVTSGATGLAGVTMTLSGAATATTTTDASGAYTFTSLVDGSYTITPSLPGYVFAPADASITVAGADVTNVDFAATAVFTVSGTVTSGGTGLAGVTMTLSGAATATTTTDASGAYAFTSLVDGSYTVTPGLAGYVFLPASAPVTVAGADVAGADFAGISRAPLSCLGLYRVVSGMGGWMIDQNGNRRWDTAGGDALVSWIVRPGDIPVVGDWNRDGRSEMGLYRLANGKAIWFLDVNGNGVWEAPPAGADRTVVWPGGAGQLPAVGDWDRDGFSGDLGVFRPGQGTASWLLDSNGNKRWDSVAGGDALYRWTARTGDHPVIGDWNRDGFVDDLGVFRLGGATAFWILDANGNKRLDPSGGGDGSFAWPLWLGSLPVVGDWNRDGFVDDLGVFQVLNGRGYWRLDNNGNKRWNGPGNGDRMYLWPATQGSLPVPGAWLNRGY
ncbi:MAG TPA: carboxypeptidase regulatory-like domain-containing protein, partial [bacterium]